MLGDWGSADWGKNKNNWIKFARRKVKMQKNTTRRKVLKGAGAVAAYAGLGLGMPNVVRANDKVVRYLGTATTMGSEIDKKLFEDTGIKVQYIPVTTDEVTKRVLTQPNSFDIVDT
jgi:putative spermidine/putrescine transport system substrate-binding protein